MLENGQVEESDWPYGTTTGKAGAHDYCALVTGAGFDEGIATSTLIGGNAVGVALRIGTEFFSLQEGTLQGADATAEVARHAVVITGFRRNPTLEFQVRNSWGPGWGVDGYGWLTSQYIHQTAMFMFTIQAQ